MARFEIWGLKNPGDWFKVDLDWREKSKIEFPSWERALITGVLKF